VRAYDPVAAGRAVEMLSATRICTSALQALDGADAAVLVTEWPEFRELDWAGEGRRRMANPLVVDGRNFLHREALTTAGFVYDGVGRPPPVAAQDALDLAGEPRLQRREVSVGANRRFRLTRGS
jgi:UDP-glucose/GDP-mannose dehydrogenase family, UDP binding domain